MRRAETVEAVSSVFFFQDQIFVVVRQNHLEAFPGYHAFPGGKIDSQDHASNSSSNFPELNPVHLSALHREMKEELDFDLQKGIAEGTISSIEPLAEIAAPSFAQIPFRNWFYRIDLKESPEFILDEGEFASGTWMTPQNLLQTYQEGKALMVPPLRRMIRLLQEDPQTTNLGDLSRKFDESQNIPELEMQEGVRILMIPSHTLPPAERTNAFRLGDPGSPQILVDPSPKSEEIYQVLLQQMKEENLDALFLTHHHPDHHQHAPDLARELGVPIYLSQDCYQRILGKFQQDYFHGVEIRILFEGDSVTRWHGEEVRVFEVPGHDAGQLALAPESLSWFIVGDLIQGIGTVVISEPEGDMATYFKTLEKVIKLQPSVIMPSHGIPMRGTFRLEATLQHRREREKQVLSLFHQGSTEQQMLQSIYQNIPPMLYPYALKNIQSHLRKLRQENRLV